MWCKETCVVHVYPGRHLLPSHVMLGIVRLAKHVVSSVLDADGIVVPVGALVTRGVVDVRPDGRRRRREDVWSHPGNGAYMQD